MDKLFVCYPKVSIDSIQQLIIDGKFDIIYRSKLALEFLNKQNGAVRVANEFPLRKTVFQSSITHTKCQFIAWKASLDLSYEENRNTGACY